MSDTSQSRLAPPRHWIDLSGPETGVDWIDTPPAQAFERVERPPALPVGACATCGTVFCTPVLWLRVVPSIVGRAMVCWGCWASWLVYGQALVPCPACEGRGTETCTCCEGQALCYVCDEECEPCGGTKKTPCRHCEGERVVTPSREAEINDVIDEFGEPFGLTPGRRADGAP